MAENVSSNVLFHFTNSPEKLKSILKHGFYPFYCQEYTPEESDRRAMARRLSPTHAIPMVSFCDLPTSLIRNHLKEYGPYGIGLTKKWGMEKGVAPVTYTHEHALTRRPMIRLAARAVQRSDRRSVDDVSVLAAYSKLYAGPSWRGGFGNAVRFYDEREWRYVPIRKGIPLFLNREGFNNDSNLKKLHDKLKKHPLLIPPDAIQYLVLPDDETEDNIIDLHEFIRKLYSYRDTILVTTTIMTENCITEDS